MAGKMSGLGLILSSSPYLRSAKTQFPLCCVLYNSSLCSTAPHSPGGATPPVVSVDNGPTCLAGLGGRGRQLEAEAKNYNNLVQIHPKL